MKRALFCMASLLLSCQGKDPSCPNSDFYIEGATVSPILTTTCEEAGATSTNLTKDYTSLQDFPKRLVVNKGGARFRSTSEFNSMDLTNVLGFIAENNELYAAGPRKNLGGIYYLIPAQDVNNQLCLAYVSASVVTEKQ